MMNKIIKGILCILICISLPFVIIFFGVGSALDLFDSNLGHQNDK